MQAVFSLHPASIADKERLAALRMEVMEADIKRHAIEPEQLYQRFMEKIDPGTTYIIKSEDQFIGCISIVPGEGGHHLRHFYLKPEWQGSGIGSEILKLIVEEHRKTDEHLSLAIFKGSAAKTLYERYGFEVVEEDRFVERMKLYFYD
ncbi:GNAT family N-acetyltransferase [Virgibacillus sp. YIM 98842]|uniref:GNAT family N-acetyltransferase n=1 Tax=Virgibacillus sp. YIM 98842 TaxID=2663533 RepID=UPI0013DB41FE|nr:GNAT family N-acetyltransferase [Virgibacillus sp. YIM 98842]